jgi:molybdenum cofactor biosynthesis enzyme MoaA
MKMKSVNQIADWPARELVIDLIHEFASTCVRINRVRVSPAGEWAAQLNILKLHTINEVLVSEIPGESDRSKDRDSD